MGIQEFILNKIVERKVTKKHVYSALNMTERGFKVMLEKDTITVSKYEKISNILSFDPCEYFRTQGREKEAVEASGLEIENRGRVEELQRINAELLKQNGELITVINNLTRK